MKKIFLIIIGAVMLNLAILGQGTTFAVTSAADADAAKKAQLEAARAAATEEEAEGQATLDALNSIDIQSTIDSIEANNQEIISTELLNTTTSDEIPAGPESATVPQATSATSAPSPNSTPDVISGASENNTSSKFTPLGEQQFNVGKILNLDNKGQTNAALKDTKYEPIVALILEVINFATGLIGTISIILLIVAGFMMMFAMGDTQKLDNAKEIIKYVIIGLLVTFMSYTLAIFVQSIFTPATS